MICWENDLESSINDKSGERSRAGHWPCRCKLLRNSSLLLRNSSLACACSSIVIRKASISAIRWAWRRSWSARASTRSRSCSALASSEIRSCSRQYYSFASWRAFMASMICCKAGALLPSDLIGPCLVFLITWDAQSQMWVGLGFIGPHGAYQMFSSVDLGRTRWWAMLDLSSMDAPRCCCFVTEGGSTCWSHSNDQVSESIQTIKFVSI